MRKEGILLGFVEAMNFVDEDDGARAILARAFGIRHDLLDFLDADQHRGKFDEVRLGHAGDDFGQRGLARAGRPPEDERTGIVAVDLRTQGLAWTNQMLLAHELVQGARTHAIRQWTAAIGGIHTARNCLEQAHSLFIFTTESQREP